MFSDFKNPIWIAGEINDKDFFISFTKRLSELLIETKEGEEITVFINSHGGETHTALGIYDLLKNCRRKTVGVVIGTAQSGASLVLQACERRLITKNSNLMLHKSTIQVGRFVNNAQSALDTFRNLDQKYYEIYSQRSGEKKAEIEGMALADKYFNPEQAVSAGLVDEIV